MAEQFGSNFRGNTPKESDEKLRLRIVEFATFSEFLWNFSRPRVPPKCRKRLRHTGSISHIGHTLIPSDDSLPIPARGGSESSDFSCKQGTAPNLY